MDDSTYPAPYTQKFLRNFELGMINAEVDTNLAKKFGVKSYPTSLLLKADGSEIDRHVGYHSPTEFASVLIRSLSGVGTLDDLLAKLAKKPDSVHLVFDVGQKYRWRGDYQKAAGYFQQVKEMDKNNSAELASSASYTLAHLQYKNKNYLEAVELFRTMAAEYPNNPTAVDAEIMIAYSYQKAEDFKNAKKEYKKFLKKYTDTEEKEWIEKQLAKMDE